MKAVQYFTQEYLQHCQQMTSEQILRFLDGFRLLHAQRVQKPQKLISLRVDERLLKLFRFKAGTEGKKYQTKIKELMQKYLES